MPSIILASAWKDLGFVMVILLAGLQAIDPDLIDAANVDGAGRWRRLFSVTLPLLSPSTFFVVVISLINGFQVFDQVYAMTGGGPGGASQVVVQQIYDLTFRYGAAGEASALSWMLFVVVLAVTVVQILRPAPVGDLWLRHPAHDVVLRTSSSSCSAPRVDVLPVPLDDHHVDHPGREPHAGTRAHPAGPLARRLRPPLHRAARSRG